MNLNTTDTMEEAKKPCLESLIFRGISLDDPTLFDVILAKTVLKCDEISFNLCHGNGSNFVQKLLLVIKNINSIIIQQLYMSADGKRAEMLPRKVEMFRSGLTSLDCWPPPALSGCCLERADQKMYS